MIILRNELCHTSLSNLTQNDAKSFKPKKKLPFMWTHRQTGKLGQLGLWHINYECVIYFLTVRTYGSIPCEFISIH